MILPKRVKLNAWILFVFCQLFLLINIQFPSKPNFDEFHYIPSAKQFIALTTNQNWEHPPLGKILMAVGIAIWGDRPIGWRFMSTVFGSLTLVGMYFLGWVIFGTETAAMGVALITLVNQLFYVQSRIGMLDPFMMGFLIWAMVAFCATWGSQFNPRQIRKLLYLSGVLLGLSMACKWFAVIAWAAFLTIIGAVKLSQKWTFTRPRRPSDWNHSDLWPKVRLQDWMIALGILPIFTYFLTFLPFLWIPGALESFADLIRMQMRMWDGQLRVISSHPYMSQWYEWPLITRPIWYAFDREGPNQQWVRGVVLIGNPIIMWGGLLALWVCAWDWLKKRNGDAFFIIFFYSVFYLCWLFIPRRITFYYYYYPSGLMLSLAFVYLMHHKRFKFLCWPGTKWIFLIASTALFIYFFPILGALKIPAHTFRDWMWSPRWI